MLAELTGLVSIFKENLARERNNGRANVQGIVKRDVLPSIIYNLADPKPQFAFAIHITSGLGHVQSMPGSPL